MLMKNRKKMRIENWRVEVFVVEEFERLRELNSNLAIDRETIFCRETPVRRYILSHYSSEDLRDLFETYNMYIEKYIDLIVKGIIDDCRALALYRKPITLRLLKSLIEKNINIVQIEKRKKSGPKKRNSLLNLFIENSPQSREAGKAPGAGARTGAGLVRAKLGKTAGRDETRE